MTDAEPLTAYPAPLTEQLMAQAREISRLRRDLDDLASVYTDLAADIVDRLNDLEATTPHTPTVWCWRDLGPAAQEELHRQLDLWVSWLRGRYPLARKVPPCWADHPETIEELTALWLAWQYAYQEPNASLTGAAEWHDRWLPGFLYRLEHGPLALPCGEQHQARPKGAYDNSGSQDLPCSTCNRPEAD